MRRRGFTLVELLVVIAIIGFLGTVTVGGYRQMQQGMEERGVKENVSTFMRGAYQRMRIDRQPVIVRYWNECLRSESEDEGAIVVGRAVAIRRYGRITAVDGNYLVDEFSDINQYDNFGESEPSQQGTAVKRLYKMSDLTSGSDIHYSDIQDSPATVEWTDTHFVSFNPRNQNNNPNSEYELPLFAFEKSASDTGDASWKVGDAYGFEFQSITLPHGYIFGDVGYSVDAAAKNQESRTVLFKPGGSGITLILSALRPSSNGYQFESKQIGSSDDPTEKLKD